MTFKNSVKTSLSGLAAHKGRSILTILGIVIGITAIIIVMAMGNSAEKLILDQIQGLGSTSIAILPGRQPEGPMDVTSLFSDSLKEKDMNLLKQKGNVPYAENVMPVVFGSGKMSYESETYQATVLGTGDKDSYGVVEDFFNFTAETGVFFSPDDVKSKASVVVIGSKVRDKLFGEGVNPVGEKIKINGKNFKIVGVLSSKGQSGIFNFDDTALLPYTTAQDYILGKKYFDRLVVKASSDEMINRTVEDIKITLRNSHGITDPAKDDFSVETQADLMKTISSITSILTILLTSIAAISLVVGGVGIMNIMLVSVTERTREIGLRKSIGATNKDILWQFLLDAVFLTIIGGIIGILLGSGISYLVSVIVTNFYGLNFAFSFPISAAILGISVSAGIGLVFGIFPARQASKKSPIEALRYE